MSAIMKLKGGDEMVQNFTTKLGYPASTLTTLGVVELTCVILYAIPQTAILGAIIMTGYLGGAAATHVRLSEPDFMGAVLMGVVAWGGLFFRDARVRALLPLRKV
jgi:hypothetical protein